MTQLPPPPANPAAGNQTAVQQGRSTPENYAPTFAKPLPVIRCTAIKNNGEQCQRWSIRGSNVCLAHGGNLPSVRKAAEARLAAARMTFVEGVDDMIGVIEELAMSPTVAEGVRLKAATEWLDRAGLKPGVEINVTVDDNRSPLDDLMSELNKMHERIDSEIVDAEEVTADSESPELLELDHRPKSAQEIIAERLQSDEES